MATQQQIIDLLRSDPLRHIVTLKMINLYGDHMVFDVIKDEDSWASLSKRKISGSAARLFSFNYSPIIKFMEIKDINKYIYRINKLSITNFSKQKFLVFDLEATGLDVKREHITQIGCVPIINGKIRIKDKFSSFICSPKNISAKISRLTGITNQQVKIASNLGVVLQKLWSLYHDFIWTAQCGFEFDFPILQNNIERLGLTYFNPKMIDTKVIFAYLHPELNSTFSTDFLNKYYKVKFIDLKRHDALNDSILIGRILQKMLNDFSKTKRKNLIIKKPIIIKKFVPKPLI